MQAGKLRQRVTIQRKTSSKDAMNQPVATWSPFATVWASVEPLAGRELERAKQVIAEASYKLTLRFLSGVDASMRVQYGTRYFAIVAPPVDVEERHRELQLLCKELVGREIE